MDNEWRGSFQPLPAGEGSGPARCRMKLRLKEVFGLRKSSSGHRAPAHLTPLCRGDRDLIAGASDNTVPNQPDNQRASPLAGHRGRELLTFGRPQPLALKISSGRRGGGNFTNEPRRHRAASRWTASAHRPLHDSPPGEEILTETSIGRVEGQLDGLVSSPRAEVEHFPAPGGVA
jgi:hypothetical protein